MEPLDSLLASLPAEKRDAAKASWLANQQRGVPFEAWAQAVRQKYPVAPVVAPEEQGAPVWPVAGAAALGAGGIYGGVRGVRGAARGIVRNASERAMTRAFLESGGQERLEQVLQGFRETGRANQPLTLSDLSPRFTAEADFVASKRPGLGTDLATLNAERNRQRPTRMIADVERIAPGGYADPEGLIQQISQERQRWAQSPEGYEGLRQRNPRIAPEGAGELSQFLDNPRTAKLWQDAASVGAVGPLPKADAVSFEVLQGLKERLDGLAQSAWQKGDGDLGRRLNASRDELVSLLDRHVPGYRQVNAKYKRFLDQERAVTSGQEWFRDPNLQLPELERRLAQIPEGDRWLVQRGMLGSYLSDIENNRKNAGFLETMQTQLPVMQKRLEVAFGGKKQAQAALRSYQQEQMLARLGSVAQGSQTYGRGARDAEMLRGMETAAQMATNPIGAIPSVTRRGVVNWFPGAVAQEMEPMFRPQTADELSLLLRRLARMPK